MTTTNATSTHALAQQSYSLVTDRLPDTGAEVLRLLNALVADHDIVMELEPLINDAITDAARNGYLAGFMMGGALTPLPLWSTDPMDAVLRPDIYVVSA